MLFASFAQAHERIHLQNLRDFPQTKRDSEINVLGKFYANLVATIQALFLASSLNRSSHPSSLAGELKTCEKWRHCDLAFFTRSFLVFAEEC